MRFDLHNMQFDSLLQTDYFTNPRDLRHLNFWAILREKVFS